MLKLLHRHLPGKETTERKVNKVTLMLRHRALRPALLYLYQMLLFLHLKSIFQLCRSVPFSSTTTVRTAPSRASAPSDRAPSLSGSRTPRHSSPATPRHPWPPPSRTFAQERSTSRSDFSFFYQRYYIIIYFNYIYVT